MKLNKIMLAVAGTFCATAIANAAVTTNVLIDWTMEGITGSMGGQLVNLPADGNATIDNTVPKDALVSSITSTYLMHSTASAGDLDVKPLTTGDKGASWTNNLTDALGNGKYLSLALERHADTAAYTYDGGIQIQRMDLTFYRNGGGAATGYQVWYTTNVGSTDIADYTQVGASLTGIGSSGLASSATYSFDLGALTAEATSLGFIILPTDSGKNGDTHFTNIKVYGESSITATQIPEPSTYALIGGIAAAGVALVARRRKRA